MKTPLNEWYLANGGKMVDFGGWDIPIKCTPGIIKEHLATPRFAVLFEMSRTGRFRFSRKDILHFMQFVLSNNAGILAP